MLDPAQLWSLIDKGGLIAALLIIVYAFAKGWVVPKWAYDRIVSEHESRYNDLNQRYDKMAQIALRTTELSERSALVGEKAVVLVREAKKDS